MPELQGMDTQHARSSSPAAALVDSRWTKTQFAAHFLVILTLIAWSAMVAAQSPPTAGPRSSGNRQRGLCGGDSLDGICAAPCSGDPFNGRYDADCFSCGQLPSPQPKHACRTPDQPCEIHEGIIKMGAMVESASYDDAVMRGTVFAYWDGSSWDLTQHWGASALDGYVVYSVVRAALEFRTEIEDRPTTRMALECMLRDHASREVPTRSNNGSRWFHGGKNEWNSWSEDFMGFALGFAAADAWLATTPTETPYNDEYYSRVEETVDVAYGTDAQGPFALTLALDPDPLSSGGEPVVMIRNHNEYSPVYATVLLKHVADINNLYLAAGLPPRFTCDNKPDTFDDLYRWVTSKIEPNLNGGGYVFRNSSCERKDGEMSVCDDRPGDPQGSPGFQREPGHYPLARYLPALCVDDGLEFFSASCDRQGPAGLNQAPHNYVFNCVFADSAP